jgi:Spy/CpxP family protein refolding chaperone
MDVLSKQKLTNALIIILVVINIISLSYIWYKEMNRPKLPLPQPGREEVGGFIKEQLNLNDEQKRKFDEYMKEHADVTSQMNDKMGELKKEILLEAFRANPDSNKVNELIQKISKTQEEYERFLYLHFQKLASVCNPEQKEKLKDIFLSSFGPMKKPGMPPPDREHNNQERPEAPPQR